MRTRPPLIRLVLLLVVLQASLTLVVWRQSQALELQRSLEAVRLERAAEEARRSGLVQRLEQLESRTRVAAAASHRFSMRVPAGHELVILPMSAPPTAILAVAASEPRDESEGG